MAYIKPGSLKISPSSPTDQTALTFSFNAVLDAIDMTSVVLGFDTVFYLLGKRHSESEWTELGSVACDNCFGIYNNVDYSITTDAISYGSWDFMVIDYGDYYQKSAPYNATRIATKTRVNISSEIPVVSGQPTLTVKSNVPGAQITVGSVTGWGEVTYPGTINEQVTVTVEASNYMVYTKTMVMTTGDHALTAILTPCTSTTPGCSGYVAPVEVTEDDSCDPTDVVCIATKYAPYLAIAALVGVLLIGNKKKE